MSTYLRAVAVVFALGLCGHVAFGAVQFEWNFNGNLNPSQQLGGTAVLDYFNAATQAATTFGTTGGSIPNPAGGPTGFVYFPGNSIPDGLGGYTIDHTGVTANGGGSYVNNYSFVWDAYIPSINWTALFNSDPAHSNDADFYVDPGGALGIGDLGYTAGPVITAAKWHRIAFVQDQTGNTSTYYVDGAPVFSGPAAGLDGRFSLYASDNTGPDLVILGEGDGSGNYANDIYLSSLLFTDTALDAATIAGFGGVNAGGIAVPEPTSLSLLGLAVLMVRRRRA